MIEYHLREGIVLTTVCGEYLLIATPKARPFCEKARTINSSGADILRILQEGPRTLQEIADSFAKEYDIPDMKVLQDDLAAYMTALSDSGYVLCEDIPAIGEQKV